MLNYIGKGEEADIGRVSYICDCALDGRLDEIDQLLNDVVAVTFRGKLIKSKTVGQKNMWTRLKKHRDNRRRTCGYGQNLSCRGACRVGAQRKKVDKIILTRPAVEAGEKLGFLPGDLQER